MGSALVENGVMRILRELDHNKSIVCLSIRTYDCQERARLYHATDDWGAILPEDDADQHVNG
jgi:hypothetical protein